MKEVKTRKVKKKKFNLLKFIIFCLIIYLLVSIVLYFSSIKIKNIVILNNHYLTDEEIIKTAKLEDYPSFLKTLSLNIKKDLKKNILINDVKIHKKLYFVLELEIEENKILYKKRSDNLYILSNNKEYETSTPLTGIPVLINFVPDEILIKFNEKFSNVDISILEKISEIEYTPSEGDKERFLLYMNDGNLVYITINKADEINKYMNILKKLDNKTGILNLDSGNYFEIKE